MTDIISDIVPYSLEWAVAWIWFGKAGGEKKTASGGRLVGCCGVFVFCALRKAERGGTGARWHNLQS